MFSCGIVLKVASSVTSVSRIFDQCALNSIILREIENSLAFIFDCLPY
jgi:hypothetical protein